MADLPQDQATSDTRSTENLNSSTAEYRFDHSFDDSSYRSFDHSFDDTSSYQNLQSFIGDTMEDTHQTDVPTTRDKNLLFEDDQRAYLHKGLHAKDNLVKGIEDLAMNKGVASLDDYVDDAIKTHESQTINIGVTGQSGSGKSSFINTFRGLRPVDEGAAKTGITETTASLEPYPHPDNDNIVLWDMPGVNTQMFSQDTYVDKVKLTNFDSLIVCTALRFTEIDLWLTNKSIENSIPFYLVRTKVDIDVANAHNDAGIREDEAMREIETQTRKQLRMARLPANTRLYLICCRFGSQTEFHFPDLLNDILKNTLTKNRVSLIQAMVSCSEPIIMQKRDEMKSRIESLAEEAASDPSRFEEIFRSEVERYINWFGISSKALTKSDVDMKKLDGKLQEVQQNLESIKTEPIPDCKDGRKFGMWFLGVGYLFGMMHDKNMKKAIEANRKRRQELEEKKVADITPMVIKNAIEASLPKILESCVELSLGILNNKKNLARN